MSVRQNTPTRGKRTYIDVTFTGSIFPNDIDRWQVRYGTGERRECRTLDELLEEIDTSFPMLTRGYVSHRYNDEGTHTVELIGQRDGEVVYQATTEPFTVEARTRLVHGEPWTPNIKPSFETTIQRETWTPNIKPSFENTVHEEPWTPNIKPSFENTVYEEPWTPNIKPSFETVIQQESWEPPTTGT
jgi:hypothetical protein